MTDSSSQGAELVEWIAERGPVTVAAFMEHALYHPDFGYYARSAQRSGRTGDFFTSVDVGPLFGQLLATQITEMAARLDADTGAHHWALVEAGAGNGRLSADILRALKEHAPQSYDRCALHLAEASQPARDAQRATLGDVADRLAGSSATLPASFDGVLIANELLDAMPVHQVVMRKDGLREVYVETSPRGLVAREGPLSTPRLAEYFTGLGVTLEPDWRADVSLAAAEWVRDAMARLRRGFAIFVDYGHAASELYSVTHSTGTLTSYSGHRSSGPEGEPTNRHTPAWLRLPGSQDLTAHVDFTTIQRAVRSAGGDIAGFMDQMYFLMALAAARLSSFDLRQRLAFKTLIMPGGLGTTMKVLIASKRVDGSALAGCQGGMRVT